MWSQPLRGRARAGRSYARSLSPSEWHLLVRLPPRVLASVLAVDGQPSPGDRRPVDEGLAGLAAIAAARHSGGPLVREVVGAIFATEDVDAAGPAAGDADSAVLVDCAAAGRVLAQRVPTGPAAEYRRWVLHIGAVAAGCHRSGSAGTIGLDDPTGPVRSRLLADYERALAG